MNFYNNFTGEEIKLFEETQSVLVDDRIFFTETFDLNNIGLSLVIVAYILSGLASIVIGNIFLNEFAEWFFMPVGIVFISVGCAARTTFAKIPQSRNQQLLKIMQMNSCDKALSYYKHKLFIKYFKTKTHLDYIIGFFIVVSLGQTFSWIAKKYYNHDVSIIIWALLIAMYLKLMHDLKLLFIPSEEIQLNNIIKIISNEQKRQHKTLNK